MKLLTQSMMKTYSWCPKKYYWEYVEQIVPKSINFSYLIGNGVHAGIQSLLKHKDTKRALNEANLCLENEVLKHSQNQILSVDDDQEIIYNTLVVEGMVANYAEYRKEFIKDVKVLFIEKVVKSRFEYNGIPIVAKPDAILKYKNQVLIYELKTTKSPSHDSIMAYLSQLLHYYIVLKNKYPLKGIYIDAIKKPQIRIGKKESNEGYLNRLAVIYESFENYYYDIFIPNKRQVEQYESFILHISKRILDSAEQTNWPHYRHMCRIYGNCPYLGMCDHGENALTRKNFRNKTSINEELEE